MEDNLGKEMKNGIKLAIIFALILFCLVLVFKINHDEGSRKDEKKEFKRKIKELDSKNDSLKIKVIELQDKMNERDKKINAFFSKVKSDDKIFKNFKTGNDAKIQYLNSISSDSLYLFLSSVRFYPIK